MFISIFGTVDSLCLFIVRSLFPESPLVSLSTPVARIQKWSETRDAHSHTRVGGDLWTGVERASSLCLLVFAYSFPLPPDSGGIDRRDKRLFSNRAFMPGHSHAQTPSLPATSGLSLTGSRPDRRLRSLGECPPVSSPSRPPTAQKGDTVCCPKARLI